MVKRLGFYTHPKNSNPMNNNLYLYVDLAAISLPLLASFYKPYPFYKKWKGLFIGIFITGLIFILWDIYFTKIGIWGFNPAYLTGYYISNLPIEEILFFICIPYASVFTYFSYNNLLKSRPLKKAEPYMSYFLIVVLTLFGLLNIDKAYTSSAFLTCALTISLVKYSKVEWLDMFYLSFLTILIPFFIVNGILTGSFIEGEIVWYNNAENLGIRMGTIPFEDTFYGMTLLLGCTWFYEKYNNSTQP